MASGRISRVVRVVCWGAATGILAVAVILGVLLLPAVQRSLLLRVLARNGASAVAVGHFHATPWSLRAERIAFTRGPLSVDLRGVEVTLSRRALLGKKLELAIVQAGAIEAYWDLDAAPGQAAPVQPGRRRGSALPFGGFLETMKLPLPIAVDKVRLAGLLALTHGHKGVADARWRLNGGGIFPGRTGAVEYDVTVTGDKGAASSAHTQGTFQVTEDAAGKLTGISLASGVGLEGGSLARWNAKVDISASSNADGETYRADASLGSDLRAEFDGRFSRKSQQIDAEVTLTAKPTLDAGIAARLGKLPVPSALTAKVDTTLHRIGETWEVTRAVASLRGGPEGSAIRLKLSHPWSLDDRGGKDTIANLKVARIPVDWANPWLAPFGVKLEPCTLDAAWDIRVSGETVVLIPSQPLTIGPIHATGPRVPDVGALTLRATPRIEVSRTQAHLVLDSLTVGPQAGPLLDASMEATASWVGAPMVSIGHLSLAAKRAPSEAPFALATLVQALQVDPSKGAAGLGSAVKGDLVRMDVHAVPLGWLGRFLPGRAFSGTLAEGTSVLGRDAARGWILSTPVPWRVAGFHFAEGGREYFRGELRGSPALAYGPTERWVRLEKLEAIDERGYRLSGRVGMGLRNGDGRVGGGVSLEAYLPHIPGMGAGSPPLRLSMSALAHLFSGARGELARLSLTGTTAAGSKVFTITADHPIDISRTPASEWLVSSPEPLRFTTGAMAVERLNPILARRGLVIGGTIPPTQLELLFSPRHMLLESKAPLAASHFHLERDGKVLIDRALLRFGASLEVQATHRLLPSFSLTAATVFRVTDGVVAASGSRVAKFDATLRASATQRSAALHDVSGSLWLDLGALGRTPLLKGSRLPAKGELTLALHKSVDRGQTVEFDGRLDHLAARDGTEAPALALSGRARGDLNQRVGGFGVTAKLLSPGKPSDLHFGMRVDLANLSVVDISSKLTGSYLDVDAVRRLAAAFQPAVLPPGGVAAAPGAVPAGRAAPAAVGGAAAAARGTAAAGAPWGSLRGHFVLDIGKVAMAPYEIDNLAGRLDLTADSLTLTHLSGEMLDGRWSADFSARFKPGDPAGAEAFDSHFKILQLDAGKAVRMRFQNPYAGADGRFDLDVWVTSRANSWEDLARQASGRFTLTGHEGRVRLALPKQDMIADALVVGGTLTFSSELRALGRFVRRISEIPISTMQASGSLGADGRLTLQSLDLSSPDLRMNASGTVADAKTRDIMGRPLSVQATLSASGDMAVILKGMHLLGPPGPDGFAPMSRPFVIGGSVGQPDLKGLYDVLAQAVDNSHGSWGLLMRKVQAEVAKRRAPAAHAAP